jgi:phosphomannomutase
MKVLRMALMISISGIRGVVGESLTPETIVKYASAYALYCNRGHIIVGRDGRITGKNVLDIVTSTLLQMGCDVIDLGICPTPTVSLAIEKLKAAGGISITASHNPMIWNGLKFFTSTGLFLDADENREFWRLTEQPTKYVSWDKQGKHTLQETFLDEHVREVLSLSYIDIGKIRARKFKVVLDCVNSAGGIIVPRLLEKLGCEIIPIHCEMTGISLRSALKCASSTPILVLPSIQTSIVSSLSTKKVSRSEKNIPLHLAQNLFWEKFPIKISPAHNAGSPLRSDNLKSLPHTTRDLRFAPTILHL